MSKKDYFPEKMDAQNTWFGTWLANIAAVLTTLLLGATHADAVKAKITTCRTKFTEWKDAKAQALSKSNAYKAALKDAVAAVRTYNQNLKTTTGYTPEVGSTIGIEGPESEFNPTTAKPDGEAIYEGGHVTLDFTKPEEVKKVLINGRRGPETTFTEVATDTNSPYNDYRPNLDPSKPENREYQIWFVDKDGNLIGQVSDTIKITVP
jgi:hypothetical protein